MRRKGAGWMAWRSSLDRSCDELKSLRSHRGLTTNSRFFAVAVVVVFGIVREICPSVCEFTANAPKIRLRTHTHTH